jgi:hypothetical protein
MNRMLPPILSRKAAGILSPSIQQGACPDRSHRQLLVAATVAVLTLLVPVGTTADAANASAGSPSAAESAVPVINLPTAVVCRTAIAYDIDELFRFYEEGPYEAFQALLTTIAQQIGNRRTRSDLCPGPLFSANDRIAFVFVDDHIPEPAIVRVLQGTTPTPGPGSVRLILDQEECDKTTYPNTCKPGWPLYTVYLFRDTKSPPVESSYTASPSASPIQAGVNQAVTTIAGGAVTIPAGRKTGVALEPDGTRPVLVTRTVVPRDIRWAQIVVTDRANLGQLVTVTGVELRVEWAIPTSSQVVKDFQAVISKAFQNPAKPTRDDLQTYLTDALKQSQDLADATQIERVYQMYAVSLAKHDEDAKIETVYTYGKLTRVTFGLGLGAIVKFNWNQQVKVSDGTLVADTPNEVVTSVNLYWAVFGGYDETMLKPSCAESLPRFVAGAVLTPDFGGFVGVAVPLGFVLADLRKFTLNGGYALMLATVPAGNAQVGDSGSMATTRRGALGGWFVTLGYSF